MALQSEIDRSLAAGMRQVTMRELDAELNALGYEREPDSRAAGTAKNLDTGNTYPSVTWGTREADTKQSAFHVDSRRDDRFKRLQELRRWTFVVSRGSIVSV